jgi:uncharacterized membrane protein
MPSDFEVNMGYFKRRIFLFGSVFFLVFIYITVKEIGKVLGVEITGTLHILCTVLTLIFIIGMITVSIAMGKKMKRGREPGEGDKRTCPVCNVSMIYVEGSGWYCQNCMDYRK